LHLDFIHCENEYEFKDSIFSIIDDSTENTYTVECNTSKKIVIFLPRKLYKIYNLFTTTPF